MTYDYLDRKVYYEQEGEGEVVFFLHGWGCDHKVFDRFTGPLSRSYKVISIDFPGFGQSEEPADVWNVEDYTRMLEFFCIDKGISDPSIIGHSFGGRVGIMFASRNTVSRLVLVDSAGIKPRRPLSYYLKAYRYKCLKWICLHILRSPETLERFRSRMGSSDYRNASPRMKAVLSAVVNDDLQRFMPSITAPTLLVWGTADTATPYSDALRMKELIPNCGIVEIPGGSHFAFLEAPDLFASVLASFFKLKEG